MADRPTCATPEAFTADTPDDLFVVGYSEGRPPILGHVNRDFTKMFGLAGEVAVLDRRRGRWRACTHFFVVPEPDAEKDTTDG